jgi:hypothetical protein
MTRLSSLILAATALLVACVVAQELKPGDLGFTDTPMLPNLPWHVHDPARPHPQQVTPAATAGGAPSDAEVLFDGKNLSKWVQHTRRGDVDARWKLGDGWVEAVKSTGNLCTREKFGDCQLHVEWASPELVHGISQERGNSGIFLMGRYEVQVLDAWNNPTYADGQAGALYGMWPPLVSPAVPPGKWNTYDIMFEAPKFDGTKVVKPAYVTVLYNGVLVHHHQAFLGETIYREVAKYKGHGAEEALELQDHGNPVRFRNIWIRRIGGYDQK